MAQIVCKNLSVGYGGNAVAGNMSFEVNKGDYLCIVGENGAGKSTVIKTLLSLLPAISGQIVFGDGLVQKNIGYLPQTTQIQKDFPASVKEIVLSGCLANKKFKPFYTKADKILAEGNMKHLGIFDLQKKSFSTLSGGQQQRVLLARALCATRQMLFLDEPVSGLDFNATHEMYDLIKKLNKAGITVVMVSHDIKAVCEFASHILHVGKECFFGSANDYKKTKLYEKLIEQGGHNNGHN